MMLPWQPYKFTHVASGKEVRGPKSTQLHRANPVTHKSEVAVGDAYTYEAAGNKGSKDRYLVEVVAVGFRDDKYYVPRCVSGNMGEAEVSITLTACMCCQQTAASRNTPSQPQTSRMHQHKVRQMTAVVVVAAKALDPADGTSTCATAKIPRKQTVIDSADDNGVFMP
jgi:hypothetical protein